jgi:hypothetical protein
MVECDLRLPPHQRQAWCLPSHRGGGTESLGRHARPDRSGTKEGKPVLQRARLNVAERVADLWANPHKRVSRALRRGANLPAYRAREAGAGIKAVDIANPPTPRIT